MRCGNCKNDHSTFAEVRACYTGMMDLAAYAAEEPEPTPPPMPVTVPAERKSPVDVLRALAAKLPDAETAYYALRVIDTTAGTDAFEFYRVDRPQRGKWAGAVFVKKQAGDEFWRLGMDRSAAVLAAIAHDPEKAMADYGHRIGRCGMCRRTLTVPESIERGIGPVCAAKAGW